MSATKITEDKIRNCLGIGEIVELIHHESTKNSPSLIDVINKVEAVARKWTTSKHCQSVAWWTIHALWHGWRQGVGFGTPAAMFAETPRSVKAEYLAKCVEVGMNVGAKSVPIEARKKA